MKNLATALTQVCNVTTLTIKSLCLWPLNYLILYSALPVTCFFSVSSCSVAFDSFHIIAKQKNMFVKV